MSPLTAPRALLAVVLLLAARGADARACPQAGAAGPPGGAAAGAAFGPPPPAGAVGSAEDVAGARARAAAPAGVWPPSAAARATASAAVAAARAAVDPNSTACQAALLMWEFSIALRPDLAPFPDAFYSLRLDADCGAPPPAGAAAAASARDTAAAAHTLPWPHERIAAECDGATSVSVDAARGDDERAAAWGAPWARGAPSRAGAAAAARTIHGALAAVRAARAAAAAAALAAASAPAPALAPPFPRSCIVLSPGTHFLSSATVRLGSADSGVAFLGYPAAAAGDAPSSWVSGGEPLLGLPPWRAYNVTPGTGASNVWTTVIPETVPLRSLSGGLNTAAPLTRLAWAQFPNFDIETQAASGEVPGPWGGGGAVSEWLKGPLHPLPTVYWKALDLNVSTMDCYNHYSDGSGGPCAHWRGRGAGENYFCGNSSDGGWVEVDALMNQLGELPFPVGMTYNVSFVPNLDAWTIPPLPADPMDWSNAPTLTVWQGAPGGGGEWYNNRFAITGHDATTHFLNLSADGVWPSGGWQGGRVWHTLDAPQGQHKGPLIGGDWHVNGVKEELDAPGEYYFEPASRTLYLFYNASVYPPGTPPPAPDAPPPPSLELIAPTLEVFFDVAGASPADPARDVVFAGLAFRDQREAMLGDWVVPSGGDWALRRAGAITVENATGTSVDGCAFVRTDANAVLVQGYARNTSVTRTEFAWIGMSAVALMGDCAHDDCTGGLQPWGTVVAGCVVRELGIVEKQSSALFLGKSALARAEGNVFFNGPRAMVNVNDLIGGGHNFTGNAVWNTCRESGDHGNFNSWHRSPFANRIATGGGAASYASAPTYTEHNFMDAGYGASQAFDNDDGSSYMYTRDNFFTHSDGWKMDYGGHDSKFLDNVVLVRTYDGQSCINGGDFVPGHESEIAFNKCVLPPDGSNGHDSELVDPNLGSGACAGQPPGTGTILAHDNAYYTKLGNATAACGDGTTRPVASLPAPVEARSTSSTPPDTATIIAWGRAKIGM